MAAFVGFIAGSNGVHFPWALTGGDSGAPQPHPALYPNPYPNLARALTAAHSTHDSYTPPRLIAVRHIGVTFADIAAAGGPCQQWDALPTDSK